MDERNDYNSIPMQHTQTAVEWLEKEINKRGPKENNPPQWLKELYEKGKQMEKEQIMNAWIATDNELQRIAAEQYYNQTYHPKSEVK